MSYIDILIFIFVFAPNILGMFCCVSAYFSLAYSEGKNLLGIPLALVFPISVLLYKTLKYHDINIVGIIIAEIIITSLTLAIQSFFAIMFLFFCLISLISNLFIKMFQKNKGGKK